MRPKEVPLGCIVHGPKDESIESVTCRSRKWIIRFAHPSGRPLGVQSASALFRLNACRNDGVSQETQKMRYSAIQQHGCMNDLFPLFIQDLQTKLWCQLTQRQTVIGGCLADGRLQLRLV